MNNLLKTDFLVSDNSFMAGVGTAMNLAGNFFGYNYSQDPGEADRKAIASDWSMVGQDLRLTMLRHIVESQLARRVK